MHQLIRVIVQATCPDDAQARVAMMFDGRNPALLDYYDYGYLMHNADARWRDSMPEQVREIGAIRADSDEGMEMIESAWKSTEKDLSRYLSVIREAVEQCDDEEILNDAFVEDVDVEPFNPLGLAKDEEDYADTISTRVRYAFHELGAYQSGSYNLYTRYGEAIRKPSKFEELRSDIKNQQRLESDEHNWYVVPCDVHF